MNTNQNNKGKECCRRCKGAKELTGKCICPYCHSNTDIKEGECFRCGGDIKIRNPKGNCDHLYYPENVPKTPIQEKEWQKEFIQTFGMPQSKLTFIKHSTYTEDILDFIRKIELSAEKRGEEKKVREIKHIILGYNNWTKWERETLETLLTHLTKKDGE